MAVAPPAWWFDASEVQAHIEDWLATEGAMLSYDMEHGCYCYADDRGWQLVIPRALFEVAVEDYMHARKFKPADSCNYQEATWELLHVQRWSVVAGELRCDLGKMCTSKQ